MSKPQTNMRWMAAAIVSVGLVAFGAARAASVAPVAAQNGMVVSAQHLATQVGVDVLKRGGNAVDAAVAVGYALAVVYPAAGNLGGGGFMTIQLADGRKTFLDFRETAPKAATANMYLDKDGNVIKGISTKGHLAVGVPGSVSGMEYAREKYGTMKRADLLAPAIQLAEQGFALDQGDIDLLRTATKDFGEDPASAGIFLNNGKPFEVGEKLVQSELAKTLREISSKGTDGFYKVDAFQFADGTVWDDAAIRALSLANATEGNDEMYGYETDDFCWDPGQVLLGLSIASSSAVCSSRGASPRIAAATKACCPCAVQICSSPTRNSSWSRCSSRWDRTRTASARARSSTPVPDASARAMRRADGGAGKRARTVSRVTSRRSSVSGS